jgi:peptide/nickel transport system permease protein
MKADKSLNQNKQPPWNFWQVFRRLLRKPSGVTALVLVGLLMVTAIFADVLAPFDPVQLVSSQHLAPPGGAYLLGTDDLGRDLFSRVIYGSRISLRVGLISVAISVAIGGPLGLFAGYIGGWFDEISMRLMDILYSFPAIILAMLITAMLGPSLTNTMIAIGIVGAPGFSRIIRGPVLSEKEREYIQAARSLGASPLFILFRHILPNILSPILVASTVSFSLALLSEAALSYLGLGVQPPEPSWGTMLLTGKRFFEVAPWIAIFPGLAIVIAVLGSNLLGDALRDVLDPRLKNKS